MVRNTGLSFGVVVVTATVLFVGFSDLGLAQINPEGINLNEWEAPGELKKSFPYYISGFDHEGQTVFIMEYGKWDIRQYFDDGGNANDLDTYADQMCYRWSKADKNLNDVEGNGFFGLIVDFDGYDARQLAHGKVNCVAETAVNNLVAPILGNIFSKVETSGTSKAKWIPLLFKKMPKESLPTWYGGSEKFRPLAVYG